MPRPEPGRPDILLGAARRAGSSTPAAAVFRLRALPLHRSATGPGPALAARIQAAPSHRASPPADRTPGTRSLRPQRASFAVRAGSVSTEARKPLMPLNPSASASAWVISSSRSLRTPTTSSHSRQAALGMNIEGSLSRCQLPAHGQPVVSTFRDCIGARDYHSPSRTSAHPAQAGVSVMMVA